MNPKLYTSTNNRKRRTMENTTMGVINDNYLDVFEQSPGPGLWTKSRKVGRCRSCWNGWSLEVSPDIHPPLKGVVTQHYWWWSGTKWDGAEFHETNLPGGSRVFPVEIWNQVWGMDIIQGLPGIVFDAKSFPLNHVAQSPVYHPAVQDFFYNPFFFSINNFQEWERERVTGWYWIV